MYTYNIEYQCKGETFKTDKTFTRHFKISDIFTDGRLTADIITQCDIKIKKFQVIFSYEYTDNPFIFVNGYQSWTDSREYSVNEKMNGLSRKKERSVKSSVKADSGQGRAGDIFFCDYPRKKGAFYGYSYGYVRNEGNVDLFASLSERNGYTIVRFDVKKSQVIVEKDFDGVVFNGKSVLIDFAYLKGKYDEVFDDWFSIMHIECRQTEERCGYTTWYNYYNKINENIVAQDLKALSLLEEKVDIFQIDDGYQKNIGDWLLIDETKFPSGMKKIADDIHSKGMLAGLWLAPFVASKDSFIYKEHKDWLVYGSNGKLYPAGPNWGVFYAIDFYNEEAADYIRKVFNVVLNEWGYDMVKLDFLYACSILPNHNKSRGQIMCEAMDFIRDCAGDKLILGCGAPLMPCFGKVDFCRIGADVWPEWKYFKHVTREDVSTPNTVNCTIFRRHLNKRAFLNDPDVFILRDHNNKMSFAQRKLLAKINNMFGSLLFVSDNVSQYGKEQMDIFLNTIKKQDIKIIKAEICKKNIVYTEYLFNGEKQELKFNYKNGKTVR